MGKSLNLWMKFKIKNHIYAMDCAFVKYINVIPHHNITKISETDECIRGIFKLNNQVITLLGLREFFGIDSLDKETEEFFDMIDKRIDEHINWVRVLKESIINKVKFTLTDDPNQCNFGKWLNVFKSSNSSVNFHINKLDEPHQDLHHLATGINDLIFSEKEEDIKRVSEILRKLDEVSEEVIDLLGQTKQVYENAVREMYITINDRAVSAAFAVDEVIGIESLEFISGGENVDMNYPDFIEGAARDKNDKDLIMVLNVPYILKRLDKAENQKC